MTQELLGNGGIEWLIASGVFALMLCVVSILDK